MIRSPLLLLCLGLSGCAMLSPRQSTTVDNPQYSVPPPAPPPLVDEDGGIIVRGVSLYSGRRALNLGDHLTVHIEHRTTADSSANTNLTRASAANISMSAMLGLEGPLNDLGLTPSALIGFSGTNDYDGAGGTNRKGSLVGTLTVQVVGIEPNGVLVVGGRSAVKINNEIQILNLRGKIDPRAIRSDNSVSSSQLVDTRMEFSGVGVVAGKQRPGWLARVLDIANPL